jgi:putative oligomerization/nucleic acid binding protein
MPGLIRGMARTAVVAGTATAVSNRVSRRQAEKWSAQDSQYVPARAMPAQGYAEPAPQYAEPAPQYAEPAPAAPSETERMEALKQLGELKAAGVLTDEEFAIQKARILG